MIPVGMRMLVVLVAAAPQDDHTGRSRQVSETDIRTPPSKDRHICNDVNRVNIGCGHFVSSNKRPPVSLSLNTSTCHCFQILKMGLYTTLPDNINKVDVIIAGGTLITIFVLPSSSTESGVFQQEAPPVALSPEDSQKPIQTYLSYSSKVVRTTMRIQPSSFRPFGCLTWIPGTNTSELTQQAEQTSLQRENCLCLLRVSSVVDRPSIL